MIELEWNGIPRNEIDWKPTIDKDKCTNCGVCVDYCHNEAFGIVQGEVQVIADTACVVGCRGCENKCPVGAITHPPQTYLDELQLKTSKIVLN